MVRRLTAIMAVDMVGSSRLMEADEVGTLAAFKNHRKQLIEPAISRHHGHIVKLTGDGALVEFGSVVEAVACALAIQDGMAGRNGDVPEDRRVVFRIGVHLGDVMVDEEDIYGDGVNVAARLEGLADPGGICISQQALDQVETKLDLVWQDMGEQRLKNIGRPVRAWRLLREGASRSPAGVGRRKAGAAWLAGIAAAAILLAVGAVVVWLSWRPGPQAEKPSVAVLPFVNISGDSEQEYFAEGITEDLITDLSKISGLTVISRTSTAGYKGRQVDVREVGQALGARFMIEGSVRSAGNQLRINAQLIDATTGGHLWAERYDGDRSDIFGLQDRVLRKIVDSLAIQLTGEERERLAFHGTTSIAAHDLYMRGLFQESMFTAAGNAEAMRLYEQALAIDPDYPLPYTRMANILELNSRTDCSRDVLPDLKRAIDLAERAVELDPENPSVHWSLGRAISRYPEPGATKRGIAALQQAIDRDPDFADAYAFLSLVYLGDGRIEDSLRSVEEAMRLNPRFPFWYLFMRGFNRFAAKDYDAAIADLEDAKNRNPNANFVRWLLAAAYAKAGRQEDAEWQVDELYLMGFDGSVATIVETQPMKHPPFLAEYMEALRDAGIPDSCGG